MAIVHCAGCKELIVDYETAVYVKPKGGPARYYCEKCVKGERKNEKCDAVRKRH